MNAVVEEKPALLKLNLGCGRDIRKDGWTNVDSRKFDGVDQVVDLAAHRNYQGDSMGFAPWPWADDSVEEIHMSHVLEHFTADERVHIANEMYRVLMPGGKATIITPHWASHRAYGDPTHCFSDETEILTKSGFKRICDVTVGELALVMDLETEKTSYSDVIGIIKQPYIGPMLHFKTERMDLLVTPNHDLVWRSKGNGPKYRKPSLRKSSADSFEYMGGHHPRRAKSVVDWDGDIPQMIRIAPDEYVNGHVIKGEFPAEPFVRFIGWYLAEGHVDIYDGHYRIDIAQYPDVNPEKYEEIVEVIRLLGCTPSRKKDGVVCNHKTLALYLKSLGKSHQKRIPSFIKNLAPSLLKLFIDAAVKGDGRKNGRGWEYASTSVTLADDMQEVALKAGFRALRWTERRQGKSKVINGHHVQDQRDMHFTTIMPASDAWYPLPTRVMYSGHQVCVTVSEHHNILVRRNGRVVWAGNCWPPVSEMWYCYLLKQWRDVNAPHTDIQWNPNGFNCDFDWTNAHTFDTTANGKFVGRNQEYISFALQNYRDAVQDLMATITKRAK